MGFNICKTTQGACIRYCYLHTSERSYSRGRDDGVCPRKAHGLLLGYSRCLGSAVWEAGLPPGHGEQQDRSPSRGLLAPRVRWGEGGWTDASGLGGGVQARNVTGIITGRKRKGQEGSGGSQLTPCRCWWSFGSNSEPEGLALRNSALFSCSFVKHSVRV